MTSACTAARCSAATSDETSLFTRSTIWPCASFTSASKEACTMRTQLSTANGSPLHPLSAAKMVAILNRQLYAATSLEKYATFYFALYDEALHTLTYTNAGLLAPMLLHGNDLQML